jgi:UDP-N-acetylmuramoylalanine--D-glutamate ligase
MKVTVMGLGINGGGLASALFFARRAARVTVTDLRSSESLESSIQTLAGLPIQYVLGRHEERDFAEADLVIKNPAVSPSSVYLQAARGRGVRIETDLSIFLSMTANPIIAVTGSKGKSTTSSAIHFGLARVFPGSRLGGNITVSPLSFIDDLGPRDPVVLELSSWQLADLAGRGLLKPAISAFTVILPDHLDKYPGMQEYVADKKAIFKEQGPEARAVFNLDDPWQRDFPSETDARCFFYSGAPLPEGIPGGWLEEEAGKVRLDPAGGTAKTVLSAAAIPGRHNRMNLMCAALVLSLYGIKGEVIRRALSEFPGIEHRLEMFHRYRGARIYNDSAATIPQATVQAVKTLDPPIVLITGGTDKNIDFSPLSEIAGIPEAIILLAGTGTEKIRAVLDGAGAAYEGPYTTIEPAVKAALSRAREGASILFSPGCTSFGMFKNEFDRGTRFKKCVLELASP